MAGVSAIRRGFGPLSKKGNKTVKDIKAIKASRFYCELLGGKEPTETSLRQRRLPRLGEEDNGIFRVQGISRAEEFELIKGTVEGGEEKLEEFKATVQVLRQELGEFNKTVQESNATTQRLRQELEKSKATVKVLVESSFKRWLKVEGVILGDSNDVFDRLSEAAKIVRAVEAAREKRERSGESISPKEKEQIIKRTREQILKIFPELKNLRYSNLLRGIGRNGVYIKLINEVDPI